MAASRHTYTRDLQCSHASVGLAQACPKKASTACLVRVVAGVTTIAQEWPVCTIGSRDTAGGQGPRNRH